MTVRHIALAAAAFLVVGLGVKLFYDVRASPTIVPATGSQPATSAPAAARPRTDGTPADRPRDRPATRPVPAESADAGKPRTVDLEASMLEANKAYDRQDFDEAKELAARILADHPTNVRMRRILVSTACLQGDAPEAQKQFDLLPMSGDARHVMRVRCKREGIVLTETATGAGFQPGRTP